MIVGVFYAVALLGSVVAFICGGFLLQIYTHFDTIDLSTSVQDLYTVFVKKFNNNNNNNNYNKNKKVSYTANRSRVSIRDRPRENFPHI